MTSMAAPTSTVVHIIQRLHGSSASSVPPSLQEQKELQQALFNAQQSPEAWSLGGELLTLPDADVNLRFFGAHTLAVKLSRDWATLSEEHHAGLKDALLGWLAESAAAAYPLSMQAPSRSGERIVLRKLTVTTLSFRLAPAKWPDWLIETITRLSGAGCSRTGIYEFLVTTIEEVGRADLLGSRRVQYDQIISDAAPSVAGSIQESLCSTSADAVEINAALRCLQGWIAKRDLNRDLLTALYPLVLNLLPNEATCINACSCVEDILLDMQFVTETRASPLLDFCASEEVGQLFSQAQSEGDVGELHLALFKLLIAVFEHSYTRIIETLNTPRSITLLRRLLLITCFPGCFGSDEQVSDLGLPIWAYLQEEISDNGIVATESGFGDPRWRTVRDVFETLVTGLIVKVTYPPADEYRSWPKDIKQGFSRYRSDVGDCLINAFYVLRNKMLGDLVKLANAHLQEIAEGRQHGLQTLEAVLYCVTAIKEAVPEDEAVFLPLLFGGPVFVAFLNMGGPGSDRIRNTVLRLIENYATWFRGDGTHLLAAVQATVATLSVPATCQSGALALAALCDANRKELTPHVASFADLVKNLEGRIPDDEYIRVLGSVAAVIQALPADQLVSPVVVLAEGSISKLASALSGNMSQYDARATCLLQLACLTACARSLSDPEDEILDLDGLAEATDEAAKSRMVTADLRVEGLRSHLLGAIKALATSFRGSLEISSALSDFLKACTSTNIATPLSLDAVALTETVSYLIEADPEAVWLSIASLLLFRLGKQELSSAQRDVLREAIARVCNRVVPGLEQLGAMESSPDIVQSFMEWSMAVLTSFVSILATLPNHLEKVVLLTIRGLELQERVGLQKCIQLLTAFVNEASADSVSPATPLLRPILQAQGRLALQTTLAGVGGRLPRSNLGYLAELLLAFSRRLPEETRVWLKEVFVQPGFPSARVSQEQRDRYAKTIMAARSLRKLKEATETFAIVCRGLEGSSYATSTAV